MSTMTRTALPSIAGHQGNCCPRRVRGCICAPRSVILPPTVGSHFLRVSLLRWTVVDGWKLRSNVTRHEAAGVQHLEQRVKEPRGSSDLQCFYRNVHPEISPIRSAVRTCDWDAPSFPAGPRPHRLRRSKACQPSSPVPPRAGLCRCGWFEGGSLSGFRFGFGS